MSKPTTQKLSKRIEAIFSILENDNPHPKGELNYTNTYTLLVAVVLSAQATDISVNKATKKLFQIVDTPEKMVLLTEDTLIKHIRTIGLFRSKASNVIALSRILVEKYNSRVPCDRKILQSLPGVGRKTANVVMNIAFNVPYIAVDTHIYRLSNRLKIAPGKTPLEVENKLEKNIPSHYKLHAHHWLILHGRYICKARNPLCAQCLIAKHCSSKDKNIQT